MKFGAASRRVLALGPGSPSTPLRCVAGFRESAVERPSAIPSAAFPGACSESGMRPGTQRKTRREAAPNSLSQSLAARRIVESPAIDSGGATAKHELSVPDEAASPPAALPRAVRCKRRRIAAAPITAAARGGIHDAGHITAAIVATRSRASLRRRDGSASRRRRRSGACRRDLPVALHGEDHRRGGLRLCLDARRRGHGRRLRQARHRRRAKRLAELRQGDQVGLGRRAPRGASRRLHRRPAPVLGRRPVGLSKIFIFDVAQRPRRAEARQDHRRLRREERRRRRPARRLCAPRPHADPGLSNKDKDRPAALVEYSNDGNYIATHWMPTDKDPKGAKIEKTADGYGYDARILPRKNVMLTSSFTGSRTTCGRSARWRRTPRR